MKTLRRKSGRFLCPLDKYFLMSYDVVNEKQYFTNSPRNHHLILGLFSCAGFDRDNAAQVAAFFVFKLLTMIYFDQKLSSSRERVRATTAGYFLIPK